MAPKFRDSLRKPLEIEWFPYTDSCQLPVPSDTVVFLGDQIESMIKNKFNDVPFADLMLICLTQHWQLKVCSRPQLKLLLE